MTCSVWTLLCPHHTFVSLCSRLSVAPSPRSPNWDDTEDDAHQCFSAGGSGPKDGRRKRRGIMWCFSNGVVGRVGWGCAFWRRTLGPGGAEKHWDAGAQSQRTKQRQDLVCSVGTNSALKRRRLSPNGGATRVSSCSAPVQITRLLFWWEWQGFYFGLLCHFSYKKNEKKKSTF